MIFRFLVSNCYQKLLDKKKKFVLSSKDEDDSHFEMESKTTSSKNVELMEKRKQYTPLKFNEIEKDSETTETTDSSRNEELEMLEEQSRPTESDTLIRSLSEETQNKLREGSI